jgi:hypothetical protein
VRFPYLPQRNMPVPRKRMLWDPSTRWETIMENSGITVHHEPWNKGKIVGQKAPFKVKDIWALRVRLQMEGRVREFALFNLGIDSKLRGCDLVSLKVRDVSHSDQVATRAIVMQHKTKLSVQFEITATFEPTELHPHRQVRARARR